MKKRVFLGNFILITLFVMLFVMLFILIVLNYVDSAGGGMVLFHEQLNLFVDVPEPPYTTPDITKEHLVRAPNTKDYWEKFQPNIRKDYLDGYSQDALKKQLTAQQLTYEEQLRRVIKDNEKVWSDIKNDNRVNKEVLERILKADNTGLQSVDTTKSKLTDSRFDKKDGKDIFQYGVEKGKIFTSDEKIKKLVFDGNNITINGDNNDTITIDSGQFYGGESLVVGEDGSGRIEKPFDNVDCSGNGDETLFIKNSNDFAVYSIGEGNFLLRDNNIFINGKSNDGGLGNMAFLEVSQTGLKKGFCQNINGVLYKDDKGIIKFYIPSSPPIPVTSFTFDPSSGSPSFSSSSVNSVGFGEFLPLISAASIDSRVNSVQSISVVGHDISLGGEKIIVEILRPFDNINGKGVFLDVFNGESNIEFKGLWIYYSRTIRKNDFFINKIRNDYDLSKFFIMTPGGSNGNYFVDDKNRLTVGDSLVKNPLEGYENVMIPKIRFEMWKKAEYSV